MCRTKAHTEALSWIVMEFRLMLKCFPELGLNDYSLSILWERVQVARKIPFSRGFSLVNAPISDACHIVQNYYFVPLLFINCFVVWTQKAWPAGRIYISFRLEKKCFLLNFPSSTSLRIILYSPTGDFGRHQRNFTQLLHFIQQLPCIKSNLNHNMIYHMYAVTQYHSLRFIISWSS